VKTYNQLTQCQRYHSLMNLTRNIVIQALMRAFIVVKGEITLKTSLQISDRGVIA